MDNNVQARIDDYLDQVFGAYEDSPTVTELRMEVRHDLMERLADLTEHGVGDEIAYAQVISSLGDIQETIAQLAAEDQVPPSEPDGPAGFIPTDQPPGETWQPDEPPADRRDPDDWMNAIADAVADGIDTARTQIAQALDQAQDTLNQYGTWDNAVRRAQARARERRHSGGRRRDRGEAWAGMSFAATDFRGADFRGQDLPATSFLSSVLRSTDFSGAKLMGSKFTASDMRDANFTQADLTGAALMSCSLRNVAFDRANLTGASLTSSDLRHAQFVGTNLTNVQARYCDLRGQHFADCRIDGADFTASDLRGASFDALRLTNVTLDRSNVTNASFRGATLHRVSFHHVGRRAIQSIVFEGTVVDQVTYLSLRSSGVEPLGVTIEPGTGDQ